LKFGGHERYSLSRQLLSKFAPKTWKSLATGTCPKRHLGPLGIKEL